MIYTVGPVPVHLMVSPLQSVMMQRRSELADTDNIDRKSGSLPSFERFERKFPLPPGAEASVFALLRAGTLPDRDYPEGEINSVYFDTMSLESFYDALNGDFRKKKVRLRWYERAPSGGEVLAFLEVKAKRGALSEKVRRSVTFDPSDEDSLKTIEEVQIPEILTDLNLKDPSWLRPVIHIRYRRHRFTDPGDGTPISLDLGIESQLLDRSLATSPVWLPLQNAVIEIKGRETELPRCLRHVRRHMHVWTSYSKYAQCLATHLENPGDFATKRVI